MANTATMSLQETRNRLLRFANNTKRRKGEEGDGEEATPLLFDAIWHTARCHCFTCTSAFAPLNQDQRNELALLRQERSAAKRDAKSRKAARWKALRAKYKAKGLKLGRLQGGRARIKSITQGAEHRDVLANHIGMWAHLSEI